jgi:hypothetical protein
MSIGDPQVFGLRKFRATAAFKSTNSDVAAGRYQPA